MAHPKDTSGYGPEVGLRAGEIKGCPSWDRVFSHTCTYELGDLGISQLTWHGRPPKISWEKDLGLPSVLSNVKWYCVRFVVGHVWPWDQGMGWDPHPCWCEMFCVVTDSRARKGEMVALEMIWSNSRRKTLTSWIHLVGCYVRMLCLTRRSNWHYGFRE